MQALTGGPSTPIEQVTELGDGIIQKLVAAGITTVEALADMTPEQLEEIPGIGEKTLERISVAVRHYFGHFEEGEEGHVPESAEGEALDAEHAEAEAGEPGEDVSVKSAVKKAGEAEVENAPAVEGDAEAEAENAEVVLEEAESEAGAESDVLTAEEFAVESVPTADGEDMLDTELDETESATSDERADNEDGA
jgi:N utilization substance protein A